MSAPLLTTKEAAERLRLSQRTLELWRRAGKGPRYIALSCRAVRYRADELDRFANERTRRGTFEDRREAQE
jgi:predicted site-specific integrase-resolvase